MTRRLALGLLLLLPAAALGWAPSASAATPTGRWTHPAPVGTYEDVPLAYQEASAPLRGFAEFDGDIQSVAFTLVRDGAERPDDPCSAAQAVEPQTAPGGARRVDWAFEAPFPCNRRYQVRATVTPRPRTLQQDTPLVLNLWIDVAIPPEPASGVSAVLGRDRSVRLTWSEPAQAPDFEGYQVRRAVGDGEAEPVAEVAPDVGEFVDGDLPEGGGSLRYEVVGMRPGPEGTTVFGAAAASDTFELEPVAAEDETDGDGSAGGDGSAATPGTGTDGSTVGGGAGPTRVRQTFRGSRPAPVRTRTTIDTGFEQTLPFAPGESPPPSQEALPSGDPAVVARLDDEGDGSRRDTMVLVAGGAAALSWALLLRLVTRRALVL